MISSMLSSLFYVVCLLPPVCSSLQSGKRRAQDFQRDGPGAGPKNAFIDDLVSEMTVSEMGASLSRHPISTAKGMSSSY